MVDRSRATELNLSIYRCSDESDLKMVFISRLIGGLLGAAIGGAIWAAAWVVMIDVVLKLHRLVSTNSLHQDLT